MNPDENVNLLNVKVAVRVRPISTVNTGNSSSRIVSTSIPLSSQRRSTSTTSRSSKSKKENKAASVVNAPDSSHICLRNPKTWNSTRQEQKTFRFDKVFPENTSQHKVFNEVRFACFFVYTISKGPQTVFFV